MNQVLKAIEDRRSIRGYEDRQISNDELQVLLKAAMESPSARNAQPWHFSVVQNKELISAIEKEALKQSGRDGASIFYGAPTVFFISADKDNTYGPLDSGIATQTIALAAHSIGLGSVILGMPRFAFAGDLAEQFTKALKIPEGHKLEIAVAIGYPATTKDAHEMLENRIDIIK